MKVKVWNGDKSKYLGEGNYLANEPIVYAIQMPDGSLQSCKNATIKPTQIPANSKLIKIENNPVIILDSGTVVYGCQVWWQKIPEQVEPPKVNYEDILKNTKALADKYFLN